MPQLPRISLITPSYQQAAMLERCLESVASQGDGFVEHIVVDGGSTDGSKEIIAAHAHRLAWWCSERDAGQSDALNKGLAHATGEVFGWLNSDDRMLPGALRYVAEAFAADPDLMILEGVRVIVEDQPTHAPQNDPNDLRTLFGDPFINQQSTFVRTSLVRAAGGVDTALHFVMDLELWWRLLFLTGGKGLRVVDRPLAEFYVHPESKTGSERVRFRHEHAGVLHGLCTLVGEAELAAILAIGYRWPAGIRPMPMAAGHAEQVRDMTVRFLLKWDRFAHQKDEFERMRRLLQWKGMERYEHDPVHAGRIAEARERVTSSTWTMHRVKRKIKHLMG